MTVQRDYSKFLNEDGALSVRLLPRPVYTELVNEYRSRDEVIHAVFEQFYLMWDLNSELDKREQQGLTRDTAAAAQAVLDQLEDADWWRVMAGFEKALARDFIDHVEEWSASVDPVYDDQEDHGWRSLQP